MTNLNLFKNSKIIPSKNFVVEGLETYLTGLNKITITNFQYLRNDLNLTIKINKSQEFSESIYDNNYNYLQVVQEGIKYYYFIIKKTQISQSTIALDLLMDTLNTYPWETAFEISPRTRVNREHKDRIVGRIESIYSPRRLSPSQIDEVEYVSLNVEYSGQILINNEYFNATLIKTRNGTQPGFNYLLTINEEDQERLFPLRNSENLFSFYDENEVNLITSLVGLNEFQINYSNRRIIDYYSEGLYPTLYKTELGQLIDNKFNSTWNLLYKNSESENSIIDGYIIPSSEGFSGEVITSDTLTYTDFEDGVYYIFAPWNNEKIILKDNDNKEYSINRISKINWNCKVIHRNGTTLQIRTVHYNFNVGNNVYNYMGNWKTITSISYEVEELFYYKGSSYSNLPSSSNGSFSTGASEVDLDSLIDINRANPKLIKIIELPYFPSYYEYNETTNAISTDSTWTYSTTGIKGFKLNDLNTSFLNTIETDIDNPLEVIKISSLNPSTGDLRNDDNESKIFHSDFYRPKFVYDSFGFNFDLEKIDSLNYNGSSKFSFEFIMTSTINSKFLFRFSEYVLNKSTEDYDNILSIARNNEAPIYNSTYINYLMSAYRYDLKAIQIQALNRGVNFASGSLKMTEGVVGSMMSKDYGQAGIKFLSWAGNIINTRNSTELERNSLEAKLESLKNQANSVSGSDDLDLLNAYSNNRAKLVLYQTSERDRKLLLDLFYYYGYRTDEIKIPNINTRYWFNFLSCELELTGLDKNISYIAKNNLIERYSEGATFLHEHNSEWDFDQVKENWETNLL